MKYNKVVANVGGGFTTDIATGIITVLETGLYMIESKIAPVMADASAESYHYHKYDVSFVSIGRGKYIPPSKGVYSYLNSYLSTISQLDAGAKVGVAIFVNGTAGGAIIGNTENFFQITRIG